MSSRQSSRHLLKESPPEGSWDRAISDAEAMLKEAEGRVRELKNAVKIFKRRRDSGEPFFGQGQKQDEARPPRASQASGSRGGPSAQSARPVADVRDR